MSGEINFTAEKRDALRKTYDKAKADGKDTFTFEGHELVIGYAKYLLQFLDTKFPKESS